MSWFRTFEQQFTRVFALVSMLAICATSAAGPIVSIQELSALVGETSQKVTEIRLAREKANELGLKLATYGGTSRELIDYVTRKIEQHGGVAEYRAWLKTKDRIHLLDFHKIQSDLDFQVIPLEGKGPLTPEQRKQYETLKTYIGQEFPGNIFYTNMDLNLSEDFFAKFGASSEHFEAISNIPISEDGIEHLSQLEVLIDGKKVNLADWGAEQYIARRLDFRRVVRPDGKTDVFGDFRQALRWIRYISENPHMTVTEESRQELKALLSPLLTQHRDTLVGYLNQMDTVKGPKILQALEKLQLYSKDSVKTRSLLTEFGIVDLAESAKVREQIILVPLLPRPEGPVEGERAGREIRVNHRTSLAASQNISLGARWISDFKSRIGGKVTSAAYGDGIYGMEGALSAGFGDIYVTYVISPDAILGVDYLKDGEIYVIRTLNAIARYPDGRLKIDEVDMDFIRRDFLDKLQNNQDLTDGERRSIIRGLATVLQPELHPGEKDDVIRVLEHAQRHGVAGEFLTHYFRRSGSLANLLKHETEFSRTFFPNSVAFVGKWGEAGVNALHAAIGSDPKLVRNASFLNDLSQLQPPELAKIFDGQQLIKVIQVFTPETWEEDGPVLRKLLDCILQLPKESRIHALIEVYDHASRNPAFRTALDLALDTHPTVKAFMHPDGAASVRPTGNSTPWDAAKFISHPSDAMSYLFHLSLGWDKSHRAESNLEFLQVAMANALPGWQMHTYRRITQKSEGDAYGVKYDLVSHGNTSGLKSLTAEDLAVLRMATAVGDGETVRQLFLYTPDPKLKSKIVDEVMTSLNPSALTTLLTYPHNSSDRALIRKEFLGSSPRKIHAAARMMQDLPRYHYWIGEFPWNRSSSEDVLFLSEMEDQIQKLKKEFYDLTVKIKKIKYGEHYQPSQYEYVEDYDVNSLKDGFLTKRYFDSRNNLVMIENTFNSILKQIGLARAGLEPSRRRHHAKLLSALKSFFPWTRQWAARALIAHREALGPSTLPDRLEEGLNRHAHAHPTECEKAFAQLTSAK